MKENWDLYSCLDEPSIIRFQGNVADASKDRKALSILVNKCREGDCFEDEEFLRFFNSQWLYLQIVLTAKAFDREEYETYPIKSDPYIYFEEINHELQTYSIYGIEKHLVESDDRLFSLGLMPFKG